VPWTFGLYHILRTSFDVPRYVPPQNCCLVEKNPNLPYKNRVDVFCEHQGVPLDVLVPPGPDPSWPVRGTPDNAMYWQQYLSHFSQVANFRHLRPAYVTTRVHFAMRRDFKVRVANSSVEMMSWFVGNDVHRWLTSIRAPYCTALVSLHLTGSVT